MPNPETLNQGVNIRLSSDSYMSYEFIDSVINESNSSEEPNSSKSSKNTHKSHDSNMSYEYLNDTPDPKTMMHLNPRELDLEFLKQENPKSSSSVRNNKTHENLPSQNDHMAHELLFQNEDASSYNSHISSEASYYSATTHSSYSTFASSYWSDASSTTITDLEDTDEENSLSEHIITEYELEKNVNKNLQNPSQSFCQDTNEKDFQPQYVTDTIGTFNINKHYSHECAAELMLKANLSLLAIQEPFGSFTTNDKSWSAYRTSNLNSAYFKAYESKHQVLIVDEEEWGGKNLEEFQCYQEGRIMAIPLKISELQCIGIISVYAITTGDSVLANGSNKKKIRMETTSTVRRIYNKWKEKYPDINIIILGDLQETWSMSNLDNLGNFRKDLDENGILQEFNTSHYSIVRHNREKNGSTLLDPSR